MVNITTRMHRKYLLANSAEPQKLFVMIKVIPAPELTGQRAPTAIALVVDTSGSMQCFADQQKADELVARQGLSGMPQFVVDGSGTGYSLDLPTRLDYAISACKKLANDPRLTDQDQLALLQFDTGASVLLPLQPLVNRAKAAKAAESLANHLGDTWMAKGMELARQQISAVQGATTKAILFTDGATSDEAECRREASALAEINCPIVAVGLGDEYNHKLLQELASISCGRPYALERDEDFETILQEEIGSSVREVITDARLAISAVKGVALDSVTRVYPSLADIPACTQPVRLGNIERGNYTVFVLELTVLGLQRPPSEARLLRIIFSGEAPALGRTYESPPQDIRVEFTPDQGKIQTQQFDGEVMGYVQQRNVDSLTSRAMDLASNGDKAGATRLLEQAKTMTRRLGNEGRTRQLEAATRELRESGRISGKTQRITSLGGRTKTVRQGGGPDDGTPGDEELRGVTGV